MARKALLVGIHYLAFENQSHQLGSAYADVEQVRTFLIDTLGFDPEDITEFRDDVDQDDPLYPSRENLVNAMYNLVADAQAGDHLVFHFSGHGSQKDDLNGDETDEKDEAIWPADAQPTEDLSDAENIIIDDEIKEILVDEAARAGAKLVIILDCCHSGTGADLQYSYTDPDGPMPTPKHKLSMRKLTRASDYSQDGPTIVSWAACQDPHLTISFTDSGGYFVKAFTQAYHEVPHATHRELLHRIKEDMISTAQGHLESKRPGMKRKHFQKLQGWWESSRSEPVLGMLGDEEEVLATPVAGTFGVGQAHGGW